MKTEVLGVLFDNITKEEAVEEALARMRGGAAAHVVTPNPEIVWMCRKDEKLKSAVNEAALVLPDGIGVIYGAKILGRPIREKIPGIEFAELLFGRLAETGETVYLLGGKPGVAEGAAGNLLEKYPGLRICGASDGYFEASESVIDEINALRPSLLLVCLGAPKQERWMHENAPRLQAGLMIGLGGALDVFAGTVLRAPERWRKLELEWLYRIIHDPRRLHRAFRLPLFLLAVVRERLT